MQTIRVNYAIEGERDISIHTTLFDINITVKDFVSQVTKSPTSTYFVFLKGKQLKEMELVRNYTSQKGIFYITKNPETGPMASFNVDFSTCEISSSSSCFKSQSLTISSHGLKDTIDFRNPKFKIFTNANFDSMINFKEIILHFTLSYEEIYSTIKKHLDTTYRDILPTDYKLLLYYAGGIPLININQPLMTFYSEISRSQFHIYAVIICDSNVDLNATISEPCNCKNNEIILSPICQSTNAGLRQIALLLGYFYHNGIDSEYFLQVISNLIPFPPLLTNLHRVMNSCPLKARHIACITSSLYTYFHSFLKNISNDKVFEYTLSIITYFHNIASMPFANHFYIKSIDIPTQYTNDIITFYTEELYNNHPEEISSPLIYWSYDFIANDKYDLDYLSVELNPQILDSNWNSCTLYHPVSPLSLRYINYPTFMIGSKDNNAMLFLKKEPQDQVQYIDPSNGHETSKKIEDLAKEITNTSQGDLLSLVDSKRVDQLIYICYDLSSSMSWQFLTGYQRKIYQGSRTQIAKSYIRSFVNQMHNYSIYSLYGLITFNDEVKEACSLTPNASELLQSIENLKPHGGTHLWDALNLAYERLINFEQEQYHSKPKRIIVISDGSDNGSEADPCDLAKKFVDNDIIVDIVLVTLHRDMNPKCCVLSHLTGGLSLRPSTPDEGRKLFEMEAFLNINKRERYAITNDMNTIELLNDVESEFFQKKSQIDSLPVPNIDVLHAKQEFPLTTPETIPEFIHCFKKAISKRERRALNELKKITDRGNPNIVVYLLYASIDEWRIFIKGSAESSYKDLWLNLFMKLPLDYPTVPPIFRFLTIPYHPNISDEGMLMFSKLSYDYSPSTSILEIIEAIIYLLDNPEIPKSKEDITINPSAALQWSKEKVKPGDSFFSDYSKYLSDKIYNEAHNIVKAQNDEFETRRVNISYDSSIQPLVFSGDEILD